MKRAAWVLPLVVACSREPHGAPIATTPPAGSTSASPAPLLEEPIVVTDAAAVPGLVGKLVTLVGKQTRTKQPTVLGVDVDDDDALADQTVQVTGVLKRWVVERDPNEGVPPDERITTRGAGTYYRVVDPKTGHMARPVLAK